MKKGEQKIAKQELLKMLGGRLKAYSFDPIPAEQHFCRQIKIGSCYFNISFISHSYDFDLTANVAIRVDAIEDIVNKYRPGFTEAEKKRTGTLGGELGNIEKRGYIRWSVYEIADVPSVCDQVFDQFVKTGFPFLENNSNLPAVHRLLTSTNTLDFFLCPFLGSRYMRAVASTYLMGNYAELRKIIPLYEAKLEAQEDLDLEPFKNLSKDLLGRVAHP